MIAENYVKATSLIHRIEALKALQKQWQEFDQIESLKVSSSRQEDVWEIDVKHVDVLILKNFKTWVLEKIFNELAALHKEFAEL